MCSGIVLVRLTRWAAWFRGLDFLAKFFVAGWLTFLNLLKDRQDLLNVLLVCSGMLLVRFGVFWSGFGAPRAWDCEGSSERGALVISPTTA